MNFLLSNITERVMQVGGGGGFVCTPTPLIPTFNVVKSDTNNLSNLIYLI